jgi:hypothetical protein
MKVTLELDLDEAQVLREHLLPMSGKPEVEAVKAKLAVVIDRATLSNSALGLELE